MPGRRKHCHSTSADATEDDMMMHADTSRNSRKRCSTARTARCTNSADFEVSSWVDGKSRTRSNVSNQSAVCISKDSGSSNGSTSAPHQHVFDSTSNATPSKRLLTAFFDQPCVELARSLLGKYIVRIAAEDGKRLSGRIVETEAYVGLEDRASHSYGGRRTARNEAMYMPPGTSYVYNIYGIYTCINISSRGDGTAVLIRALEPVEGLDIMLKNRGLADKGDKVKCHELCNGPSKLTKALSIVKSNGDQVDLATCSYLWLEDGEQVPDSDIVACSRIGIGNYAMEWTDKPLRFYVRGCRSVSVRCKPAEDSSSS